jgi:hypothetical protein
MEKKSQIAKNEETDKSLVEKATQPLKGNESKNVQQKKVVIVTKHHAAFNKKRREQGFG